MSGLSAFDKTSVSGPAASSDALDRLIPLGWGRSLALILAALALSFALFGYAIVYWRNADMDFMVIYNALVINDGKPQQFFDHPAYLTILMVRSWFAMLHRLGLLESWRLTGFPTADAFAFDAAMTQAVRAGRVLAFLVASGSVLIFAGLARLIVRDWRVAMLAVAAFALSGGIAVHSRILRSELIAACPVIFALMIMIAVGERASAFRPLALAAAGALCVFGLENKVQAILLIALLPLVILPFGGTSSASVAVWRNTPRSWLLTLVVWLAAGATLWLCWPLARVGLDRTLLNAAGFHPLLLARYGIYQAGLILLILAAMSAYALLWRISIAETIASIGALASGAALALLLLDVVYADANVIAVFNPLEKMLTFADASTSGAAYGSASAAIGLLLQGMGSVLARYSFVLHPSARPTVFLSWLIVPGMIVAWRHGERQCAVQAFALIAAALAIDTLGVRRGLKSEYFIFSDPLIILAGAVLLDRLPMLRANRLTYPIGLALILLHIAVGQSEPVKYALKRSGPQSICEWSRAYMPLLPPPWCAS